MRASQGLSPAARLNSPYLASLASMACLARSWAIFQKDFEKPNALP